MSEKIVVTLHIEASEWALGRPMEGADRWVRTWKDWPEEKALAAHVVCIKEGHFRWGCWGVFSEGHIGYGRANTLEDAQKIADATLREYCRATKEEM